MRIVHEFPLGLLAAEDGGDDKGGVRNALYDDPIRIYAYPGILSEPYC